MGAVTSAMAGTVGTGVVVSATATVGGVAWVVWVGVGTVRSLS